MAAPVVSVCIITYQHAKFIARTIEGALQQRTDFPVEILIGEDESSDGTREICLDYARNQPDRIKVFLRSRKDVILIDGKPRGGANLRATIREARGEFVALCEGDDYWTDPEKLQRQVDFLRKHGDHVGCFHDASLVDANGHVIKNSYFQSKKRKFSQHDVIETLMSSYPTCSLMFRRTAFEPLPEWFLRRPCDLYIDIHLTSKGALGFINRNMGAYRKHAGGIWSSQREANQIVELIIRYKLLLADTYFLETYRALLFRKIEEFQSLLFTRNDHSAEVSRLETIAVEQTNHVATMTSEITRLQAERDAFRQQLDRASETTQQQERYITTLEGERDRLTVEGRQAREEVTRIAATLQQHIDSLKLQLSEQLAKHQATVKDLQRQLSDTASRNQQVIDMLRQQLAESSDRSQRVIDGIQAQLQSLAETARRQKEYVTILEKERDRLVAELANDGLQTQLQSLAGTARRQQEYVTILEKERDRLVAELANVSSETSRRATHLQQHIDSLRQQLDRLGATSQEQAKYIEVLQQDRDRLQVSESRIAAESAHYIKVINEQLAYIRVLEQQRERAQTRA